MAEQPESLNIHNGMEVFPDRPRGVGVPRSPGNITPESSGEVSLAQVGRELHETRQLLQNTGRRSFAPHRAKSWIGVVTAQLRMMSLWEIYEDVESYSGAHLAKIQDIIAKEGGPKELKSYTVPVVAVRVEALESGTPAPAKLSCTDPMYHHDDPIAISQRKYIGLGSLINRQSMMMPPVGSTVEIQCDNDYFYSHDGKYNGYFTKIVTPNTTRTLHTPEDCVPDSPQDNHNGTQKPQSIAETEQASAEREPECTEAQQRRADRGNNSAAAKCQGGWYSDDQPKGKDGQRAFGRGGLVDFAKDFWGSATKSYSAGRDKKGEPLTGQERTQNLRSQKPSNQ